MKKRKSITITLTIILTILVIILTGCIKQDIKLEGVEISNYQGEKLSSVNDFHENSIKGIQYIKRETYNLKITGLVEIQKNYTYYEILNNFQHYEKVVNLDCVEGWSVTILWEGILIKDLLADVQPLTTATTIIFKAYDGYTTSFPINYTIDNKILLAYKMNNVTLPEERGFPFQLVAESKWGYKWIKWITEIEISDNSNYEGYWESRGYSNSGDTNQNFIGK